jgi:hypothetical protein
MPRNLSAAERDRIFGPLRVVSEYGRDGVKFETDPPIVNATFGRHTVRVHELARDSLQAVAGELQQAGLLDSVSVIMGYSPRRTRTTAGGNTPTLSAHAYGAAVDVNPAQNPQGTLGTEAQAELAPYFERHGWFWGRHFTEPDPHHFAFQGTDPLAVQPPIVPYPGDEGPSEPEPGPAPEATRPSGGASVLILFATLGFAAILAKRLR